MRPFKLLKKFAMAAVGPKTDEGRFAAAIVQGHLRLMQTLLQERRVDPNGMGPDKDKCWLRYAVDLDLVPQTKILLEHGADPIAIDGTGISVLDHVRSTRISKEVAVLFTGVAGHP